MATVRGKGYSYRYQTFRTDQTIMLLDSPGGSTLKWSAGRGLLWSFHQVWYKLVVDCMRNANHKSLFRNGEENEKVIRNPHADPDCHQKLTI